MNEKFKRYDRIEFKTNTEKWADGWEVGTISKTMFDAINKQPFYDVIRDRDGVVTCRLEDDIRFNTQPEICDIVEDMVAL